MGLEKTNFINCTGMHHEYHYTTCRDMATIMAYAMQNPLCAEILSRKVYKTTTSVYSSGITFYHDLLVTRFERQPVNFNSVEIVAGKTGWTGNDSGYCVVSYAKGDNGHSYILVTAGAQQKLSEIIDMATIYNQYVD
jgi:D-alanyl-D-alanine carboxypeptidase (penicillin-binding protein 5/6)